MSQELAHPVSGSPRLDAEIDETTLPRATLPEHRRRPIDYRRLRELIPVARVLEVAAWTPTRGRGRQVRGVCPLHEPKSARSADFSVNLARHIWKCFQCGKGGNQIDLWSALTQLPIYEAALDLCERTGTPVPWLRS